MSPTHQIFLLFCLLYSFSIPDVFAQRDWQLYGVPDFYATYLNETNKLYKELFENRSYQRYLSPIYENMPKNWTDSKFPRFMVVFILAYSKLLGVDAQAQTFSLSFEMWMQWQDVRLSWNPKDFGGLEYIWVNPQVVWMPEHDFGNAKTLDRMYDEDEQTTKLWFNGSITQIRAYYAEVECAIDVAVFPFDRQFCQIGAKAGSYNQNQVMMVGAINDDFPANQTSNGEWDVHSIVPSIIQVGGQNMLFDMLYFTFELRRVPNFYIYVIALPCFILTLLSITGMFWSANEREEQIPKLSIGLTSLVSMTVLLQMVSESIPKTTKFPLLGIFVVIDVMIISVGCVFVVAFTMKHSKKASGKTKKTEKEKRCSFGVTLFKSYLAPHILLHLLFQALHFVNFIVLMSFWRKPN